MGMFMERCVELIEIAICSTTIFLVENISYLTFFHNEMTATFLFRRKKWLIPSVVSNLDEHRKRKKIRPDVPNREKKTSWRPPFRMACDLGIVLISKAKATR